MKAELLRKQEEVSREKKNTTDEPYKLTKLIQKPKSSHKKRKVDHKDDTERQKSNKNHGKSTEELELLANSKRILEAKSKFYERMTATGGSLNSDVSCLVQFNKKKQDDRCMDVAASDESDASDVEDRSYVDVDGEWAEFTDCLGRTRKCLQKGNFAIFEEISMKISTNTLKINNQMPTLLLFALDLSFYKAKDKELAKSMPTERVSPPPPPQAPPTLPVIEDDNFSEISTETSKITQQRYRWEQTELANVDRDEIHYQDVFFDEARTHGVSYYAFSGDKTERQKQQQALDAEREKTRDAQQKRESVRSHRDKVVFDRIFAAKNRQRARLGLPFLTLEEFEAQQIEAKKSEVIDDAMAKKEENVPKSKSSEKNEEELQLLDEKRREHLRPWDIGKSEQSIYGGSTTELDEETKWEYKPEKTVMSQYEWNENKRTERNPEFAPPQRSAAGSSSKFKSNEVPKSSYDVPKTSRDIPKTSYDIPKSSYDLPKSSYDIPKTLYAEPKTSVSSERADDHEHRFKKPYRKRAYVDDDNDDDSSSFSSNYPTHNQKQTEDIYKPSGSNTSDQPGLIASIDAGLQYLREQSDKNKLGTKSAWVTKTTYEES